MMMIMVMMVDDDDDDDDDDYDDDDDDDDYDTLCRCFSLKYSGFLHISISVYFFIIVKILYAFVISRKM